MDLETENRIAAVLLREAAELRRQAQQDGVLAYLRQPTVRDRPNSRFLTATVRGIQQINKAVEVDEMWRIRQKELELEDKIKDSSRDSHSHQRSRGEHGESSRSQSKRHDLNTSCSSSKRSYEKYSNEDEGLKDEEIEAFLHSRVKRGRGSVGSRMDEAGPYLSTSETTDAMSADYSKDERDCGVILGPEKPSLWKRHESLDGWSDNDDEQRRSKKTSSGGSKKKHSKKHKSREKSRDKKKKKKSKRYGD